MHQTYLFRLLVSFFFLGVSVGFAQQIQPFERGPIHEAFIEPIREPTALQAIGIQPPPPLNQTIPPKKDHKTIWIQGYWSWDNAINDFIWISGIWRNPPPDHIWISGYWKQFPEGWVWIKGFWSAVPLDAVTYIEMPPPDPEDEDVDEPPSEDMFWVPGYWNYNAPTSQYQWVDGEWHDWDPQWILTPTHYLWRPEGYVMVPAFWDWMIEDRGQAFRAVIVPSPLRAHAVMSSSGDPIEVPVIIIQYFVDYPDYCCVFHHHYWFHRQFWDQFPYTPPWWKWNSWWAFNWNQSWGLWWWYGHPGYPSPRWLSEDMTKKIPPPPASLSAVFANARPPLIITPKGVVTPGQFRTVLKGVQSGGKMIPVVSTEGKFRERLEMDLGKEIHPPNHLRPAGNKEQPPKKEEEGQPKFPLRKPIQNQEKQRDQERSKEQRKSIVPVQPKLPAVEQEREFKLTPIEPPSRPMQRAEPKSRN
jgi:WXXGXW repeat (2 copies)